MMSLAILKTKFGREFQSGRIIFSLERLKKFLLRWRGNLFQHFS